MRYKQNYKIAPRFFKVIEHFDGSTRIYGAPRHSLPQDKLECGHFVNCYLTNKQIMEKRHPNIRQCRVCGVVEL